MSLEDAEIPDRQLGEESLGPVTKLNRRLYFAVIVVLGVVLVGLGAFRVIKRNE